MVSPFLSFSLLLLITSLPHAFSRILCRKQDSDALLRIKAEMDNASYVFTSWDPATDCCRDWWRVQCSGDVTGAAVVVYLELDGSEYTGPSLPPSLGDLSGLALLFLSDFHNIAGPLPRFFTKLQSLRELTIVLTSLSGPVPSFLSSLPNLTSLNLAFNNLNSSIPKCFGLNMTGINLSQNQLTGRIPSCLGAKGAAINLSGNRLSGRIPDTLTGDHLSLADNNLTGKIPSSFAAIDFKDIRLQGNRLTGDASFLFGLTKNVSWIELSNNRLSFNLSKVEFAEGLSVIRMSHNKITGGISETINKVTNLGALDLSYNRLCGPIPNGTNTAMFMEMHAFDHNKCLCGLSFPPCS